MATILVVDDDPDVLSILCSTLAMAGHEVTQAGSGMEALDLLEKGECVDLMLTDVIMPGLNGFNLAYMARSRCPFLKILYLTAFHERALAMRDRGDKLGKLLTKPIMPDELSNEVNEALSRSSH